MTSCNKAFKLHDPTARWCGDCPKCRFVFLAMAPAMDRARLHRIFGRDLFADPAQVPGFLELLGIDAHKPFECVGEVEESLVALAMLANDDAPVLVALRAAVPPSAWAAVSRDEVLTPGGPTLRPTRVREGPERRTRLAAGDPTAAHSGASWWMRAGSTPSWRNAAVVAASINGGPAR